MLLVTAGPIINLLAWGKEDGGETVNLETGDATTDSES